MGTRGVPQLPTAQPGSAGGQNSNMAIAINAALVAAGAWFNVTNYASLSAALADISSNGGGVLYIPGGTTVSVSSSFTPPANTWIVGDGESSIIAQSTTGSITIANSNAHCGYLNFAINYTSQGTGPGGNNPTTGGIAIYSTAWPIHIDNVRINNAYIGVELNNTNIQVMNNLWIQDPTYAGVFCNAGQVNMTATNCSVIQSTAGVLCSQAGWYFWGFNQGHSMVNCTCYGAAGRGFWARSSTGSSGQNVNLNFNHMIDCWFDSTTLDACWIDYSYSNSFICNEYSGGRGSPGGHGFVLAGGDANSIIGCQFQGSGNSGLLLGSSHPVHTTITGNQCIGNNVNAGSQYGIYVSAGVTDFSITNNVCGSSQSTGAFFGTQTNPIFVATGASNRYIITGNLITGDNTNNTVSDGGSGGSKQVTSNF